MEVEWKGKIGYGDIVSPICYVHNESLRRKENVNLKFFWGHSPGTKFKPQDPETIDQRADFIFTHTERVDGVTMQHVYNQSIEYNHTNYFDKNLGLHNLRFSDTYRWTGDGNHIVVVSSLNNKKQFSEYAKHKMWKDPLAGKWEDYITELRKNHKVEMVGYDTPVKELAELIQSSKLLIGYHGSAVWMGKWIGAPMLIYSSDKLTDRCLPWCVRREEPTLELEAIIDTSVSLIEKTELDLKEYLK